LTLPGATIPSRLSRTPLSRSWRSTSRSAAGPESWSAYRGSGSVLRSPSIASPASCRGPDHSPTKFLVPGCLWHSRPHRSCRSGGRERIKTF